MTTMDCDGEIGIADLLPLPTAPPRVFGWFTRFAEWRRSARLQRIAAYELSRLDRHLLRDIGIEPDNIEAALSGRGRPILFNTVGVHPLVGSSRAR